MSHKCRDPSIPENQVNCLNSLCKQKGIQIFALKDIKLVDLQPVLWLFKNRLKIILLQESLDENATKLQVARKCDRLMSDSEKCAELEQFYPGIHSVYFIEDFAYHWYEQALELLHYVGLDSNSMHTKLGIKKNPLVRMKRSKNIWLDIISKCHVK